MKEVGLVGNGPGEEGLLPLLGCALLVRSQNVPWLCPPRVILTTQGSAKEAFDLQA